MTGSEIRQRFLSHFELRDHLILDSAPLVPADDPSTLFVTAGMQPLQPYYQGLRRPPHGRLSSCQKCLRTGDLDEVGRTDRHQTFFEMLGNFAPTGAYFKETAIPLAWELVTEGFQLPADRIRVTTHPSDEEAREVWRDKTGVNPDWIYVNAENWWGLELGACGPDSEVWWDRGEGFGCDQPDCYPDHCDRFLEFWNLVFPQFDRQADGSLRPLPAPAIDTGMGLERVAAIVQGVESNFDTDLFLPLVEFVRQSASTQRRVSERVIADHLRAMTFVVADGVLPANEGRGYVLRRIIRRAALHARRCGLGRPLADGIAVVVEGMGDQYPYLSGRREEIQQAVASEADRFNRTLEQGMELFERFAATGTISGADAFRLHDTFGFPLELTRELAAERGLAVDEAGFAAAMEDQRRRSRKRVVQKWADLKELPQTDFVGYEQLGAEGEVAALRRDGQPVQAMGEGEEGELYLDATPFYPESGGQVGDSGTISGQHGTFLVDDTQRPFEGVVAHLGRVAVGRVEVGDRVSSRVDAGRRRHVMRHHTATHLLNRALEELLGRRGLQRGSLVGPDKATFDFPLDRPLSADEIERLEARVNEQVRAALPFRAQVLPYDEAVQTGATHLFDEKYGERVRVVCFGDWTCEFCGGTHSSTSADVGLVLITSESSIGRGLRRIELVAGEMAERLVRRRLSELTEVARSLGVAPDEVSRRVSDLRREMREAQRQVERLRDEVRSAHIRGGEGGPARRGARVPLIAELVPANGMGELRSWADRYLESLGGSGVVAVANDINFVVKVSRDLAAEHDATNLAAILGRGGGRPDLVQGRLTKPAPDAFNDLEAALQ